MSGHGIRIQLSACGEGEGLDIAGKNKDAEQHQRCAENGIDQVLDARGHRFLIHGMHDQGNREQGHQFIEHIVCNDGTGEAQADEDTERGEIETVEPFQMALVFHVFKGIEAGKTPDDGNQGSKTLAGGIRMQEHRKVFRQTEQRLLQVRGEQYRKHQKRIAYQCNGNDGFPRSFSVQCRNQGQAESHQNGKENGNKKKKVSNHGSFLLGDGEISRTVSVPASGR